MKKVKIRYRENPFLQDLVVTKQNKQINFSTFGSNVLLNQITGEVQSTHLISRRQVDDGEFVKIFTRNIALTFDMTSTGTKALAIVMWAVQNRAINKDVINLDAFVLRDFLEENQQIKSYSLTSLYRGIDELIVAHILARQERLGTYFINPNFIFNGDRVAFTQIIERKKKSRSPSQNEPDMFDALENEK
jgi:hypothetical protein